MLIDSSPFLAFSIFFAAKGFLAEGIMRGARASLTTSLLTSLVLPAASFAPPHRLVAPSVLRAFFSGAAVGANLKDLRPGSVVAPTAPSVRAARIFLNLPLLRLSMVAPGPICAACFECSVPLAVCASRAPLLGCVEFLETGG